MTLEELEKRVRALEDLEEIKKLHRQYINYLDTLQFDKVPALFTENATAKAHKGKVYKGKKEIVKMYTEMGKHRGTVVKDGHFVGEPIISVEGERAKGRWTVLIFFSEPSVQWTTGKNVCEYVKEDGKWKISSLTFDRTFASLPSLYL
jgi:hypothetical protein